jgi:hypothetical protein
MGAPVLRPLFGWIVWLLFRKDSYQRGYINGIEDFLSWFPNFISDGIAHLLINDISMIIYILFFGLVGLCFDAALSR